MKQDRRRKAAGWLFPVFLFMAVVSGCVVAVDFASAFREEQFWDGIRSARDRGMAEEEAGGWKPDSTELLPEYRELYERNPDMAGWLTVGQAKIDCPVMQTKDDPEHYLRRDFDGKDDGGGTPFVDARCSLYPRRSFNVIVYGHYTNADHLFRRLLDFAYQSRKPDEDRGICFDTLTEKGVYELAAAFYYDGTDAVLQAPSSDAGEQAYTFYNYIELDSKDGFEQFVREIEERRLYDTGVEITPEDELLTLVCCAPEAFSGIEEGGRFVVIARKVT